ncbi:MAG: hypothetical protein IKJ62_00250 [Alphaproteobacteria bacterium]|nr:hypothetical protein [Alphaproteobacteria bacterium]MBR3930000.1 hypothetical protein [Alphaproteobacteria bacterium]MBR4859778.1 hypothetical protein [Alphaproteobacteria bacterium]
MKTYEQQLSEVQQAITDILTGAQEASYNGQRVTKASLDTLQKREEWLIKQIKTNKRAGIRVRNVVAV